MGVKCIMDVNTYSTVLSLHQTLVLLSLAMFLNEISLYHLNYLLNLLQKESLLGSRYVYVVCILVTTLTTSYICICIFELSSDLYMYVTTFTCTMYVYFCR